MCLEATYDRLSLAEQQRRRPVYSAYSGDTRPWRKAAAKADYVWRKNGFPQPRSNTRLLFAMIAMVRYYYLNPSCFFGDVNDHE